MNNSTQKPATTYITHRPCKNGDLHCGAGYWTCGKCEDEMHRAIYKKMTPAQKAYDNYVDPLGAYHTDYDREPQGCSCHINPPCNYCISQDDNIDVETSSCPRCDDTGDVHRADGEWIGECDCTEKVK